MSGALAATDLLQEAVAEPLRWVAKAVTQARHAQADMNASDDIMDTMRAVADIILACEDLQAAAKHAEATCRAKLAETMADTGATGFQTAGHTVSLKDAARSVTITDEAAIPAELWTTPEPRPDKKAIASALAKGGVNGATFGNRPPPIVQIKTRGN